MELALGAVAPHAFLFGEDATRAVVSFAAADAGKVEALCKAEGVPYSRIGTVGGDRLTVKGLLDAKVAELEKAWRGGIPAVLGL